MSVLMPRGGLFALTPACYYFGCIACWLVRHSRACAPKSRTIAFKHLTTLFLNAILQNTVKNGIHQFNVTFNSEATSCVSKV